jgi:hypothetical protein
MEFGQISESKKINEAIYNCFRIISNENVNKFVKLFKEQPHNNIQIMHTFRELLLGAFLSNNGFHIEYNRKVDNKTPDWCIIDDNSRTQCFIELINFHTDLETTIDIYRQFQAKGLWCNFTKPNIPRLYQTIWEKSSKYKSLANKHNIPYVVSLFGDFAAGVDQEEIDECLFDKETGLFEKYPEVSGLLYFEENAGKYIFIYKINPFAFRRIEITNGIL